MILSRKGFTLVEVLLAMMILAFLMVSVTQALRRSTDFKVKIQKNIDRRSAINSAMRLIERDINLAFHYQDVTTAVLNQLKSTAGQPPMVPGPNGVPMPPPQPPPNPNGTPAAAPANPYVNLQVPNIPNYTAFIGNKNDLSFTNLNNISTQGGQNFGDQEVVGYYVKSCHSIDGKTSSDCLWRRTSSIPSDDLTQGGESTVLLENVKKFELRYFGKEKEDWVDQWHSDGKEDGALKDKFPQAVEVTLTVLQDKKEISAIRVIPLRFPNNDAIQQTLQPPGVPGAPGGPGFPQPGTTPQ